MREANFMGWIQVFSSALLSLSGIPSQSRQHQNRQIKSTLNVDRVMICLMKAKTLSLHIRAVGHWTNSLYQYFEKEQAKLEGTSVPVDKRSRFALRLFPHITLLFPGCEKQSAWQRTEHEKWARGSEAEARVVLPWELGAGGWVASR